MLRVFIRDCSSLWTTAAGQPLRIVQSGNTVELEAVAPNILRVHVEVCGCSSPRR